MPELPEVETIRLGLVPRLLHRTIIDVSVWGNRVARAHAGGARDLENCLRGRRIDALLRRGKFMWAELDSRAALVFHLGMSGQIHAWSPGAIPRTRLSHEHARIRFDDGGAISFIDQRTFGRLEVSDVDESGVPESIAHIGLDPLDPLVDHSCINRRIRQSKSAIKTILLNQHIVSGIGNIYADEALFAAGVHGARKGTLLRRWEVTEILHAAEHVMRAAIEVGGTSFDALYVDVDGNPGYFARSLAVYGREGEHCEQCGGQISRIVLTGRTHYFCRTCQPRSGPGKRSFTDRSLGPQYP
ncbi:MAG: bifunctional DNA-formamidopyrimidine glycosylase/DNA-(apurinic or apyrimidinic site) lyase [Actinomycetaceae bacterium]|nr:bifunctional DNA-formamidopyrimidine glycosylase/DNA-(apurinic or apyrimidinic site) lyase [Actinomycetaceae bacterium]